MKKVLMLMTILSFVIRMAWAENTDVSRISNTIYIENFSLKVGEEKVVSVKMKNNFAPTGFQFDIVLPEGINIKTEDDFYCIDLSTARTTSRKTDTFSSARRSDGSVRVICSSTNNYTFSGNDGEVASIVFTVNDNVEPGNYTLTLKNIELSEANGTAHPVEFDVKSTITVTGDPRYTVQFFDYDNSLIQSLSLKTGDVINAPSVASREGYTFTGWEPAFVAGTKMGTSNLTYTAKYSANTENEKNIIASGKCGENATWTLDDEGLLTISGTGAMTEFDMPWKSYSSSIKRVQIEDGITTIGSYVFFNCKNLTSVTIPASMMSMLDDCFLACTSLTSIEVDSSNKKYTSVDGVLFTADKKTLLCYPAGKTASTYTIPTSVTAIGPHCFYACQNLTNIKIPSNVTSLGEECFYNCSSLTNIEISNGVTSLGAYCFQSCSRLTDIDIPASVSYIGDFCFGRCSRLTNINVASSNEHYMSENGYLFTKGKKTMVRYPEGKTATSYTILDGVTSLGNGCFLSCKNLTDVEIPASVTSLGNFCFQGCINLTNIEIPMGVSSIGSYCFDSCTSLTNLAIPASVTSLGQNCFDYCSSLNDVTNYSLQPQVIQENTFRQYGTLHVVKGAGEAYANADYWKNFTIVEDLVNVVASGECGENATWTLDEEGLLTISGTGNMNDYDWFAPKVPWYEKKETIKNVIIKDGITNVGSYSFYLCKNLENLVIANSVVSINNWAFSNCNNLKTVEIPSSVKAFGIGCFAGCSTLQNINVSTSNPNYTSIDGGLFTKDRKIMLKYPAGKSTTSYSVPDGVEKLESYCFYGCSNLQSIELPNGVNILGEYCFEECGNLSDIVIPNSVTYIGEKCFHACMSLKNIDIPSNVTQMGGFCFAGCWSLENVTISNGITFLNSGSFNYCTSLSNVIIPEGIENIDMYAFKGCRSLKSIELPSTLKTIGTEALAGCPLESVTSFATIPPAIDASACSTYGTLHVLKGYGEAYRNAEVWKNFTIVEDAVDPNAPIDSDTDISEYDNILYLDKTEVRPGQQAVLSFKMKNTAAIQTIGVYLELPTGMTVAEDDGDLLIELSAARTKASRHAISSNYVDGQYRIGILGIAGREFEGTDGEVFTVTVDVDEEMAEGDYPVILRNINLTDTSDVPHDTSHYKTTISVVDITPGDANGDGSVNMSDANMVTNYFLSKSNAAMKAKAADVNNDGSINMTDANMIVNMYLNQ